MQGDLAMRIGTWDSDSGRVFCIAEAGVNHNGLKDVAFALVDVARLAGADAVKFQWFDPDALVARRGPGAEHVRGYALSQRVFLELKDYCDEVGITFLCSVFDLGSLHAYMALEPAAIKLGSGEFFEDKFQRHVAAYDVPIIVSTGMADDRDLSPCLRAFEDHAHIALLHCVSAYPCPTDQVNLAAMDRLSDWRGGVPVGFSDHTQGTTAAMCAVARGACIIEKHLTLDKGLDGPDHAASADPREFAELVSRIRLVESILGDGVKRVMPAEAATLKAIGR